MINKIINIVLFVCLPIYVAMTSYYTLLVYDFSWSGFILTFSLTILPTIVGIYFGVALKTVMNKKLNKQKL